MMKRPARRLASDSKGVVAPLVALSLFGLIAVGGIAFDYARLATMNTELQDAADQAALAGASQLDGQTGAVNRAVAAAQSLLVNRSYLANDNCGTSIETGITNSACSTNTSGNIARIYFYPTKADAEADTNSVAASVATDAAAKYVKVAVVERKSNYALTPIVGAISSGYIGGEAVAGLASSICKVPPVMLCNPDEPSNNADENLPFNAVKGVGLRLVTGNATVPGNFGWLEANVGNGANALAATLGYNSPLGDCSPITGVTTKTGMDTSVLNAFNTRFDVYANGNSTCPSQYGGTCSPSTNTRKDLVCNPDNKKTACQNGSWSESSSPYHLPTTVCVGQYCHEGPLPTNGSQDPAMMGYPHDYCQVLASGTSSCSIKGNGSWDRDAYFRVNYGYGTSAAWQAATNLGSTPSRYDVYAWELANRTIVNGSKSYGIDIPQINGNEGAFSYPATGTPGVAVSSTQADRRRISIAVLNCQALNVHGKTVNAPVTTYLDSFLVEPAVSRTNTGSKEIYVEIIGNVKVGGGSTVSQTVRRDTPYLVK